MDLSAISSRAIVAKFYQKLEAASPWALRISNYFKSDQSSETYKFVGATSPMREWVGGRQMKGLRVESKTIANKPYECSLEIPAKDLRRAKSDVLDVRISELAARAANHWNDLAATILANNTSYTCTDGQYLFDTDHSSGASGTQTNALTSTEVPALNVSSATAPTPSEASKAGLGMIGYVMGIKDDQGKVAVNQEAKSFLFIAGTVPIWASLWEARNNLALASGEMSALAKVPLSIDVLLVPELAASTTTIWLFRTDGNSKALIAQEEESPTVQVLGEDSDYFFENDAYRFGVKSTRGMDAYNWLSCATGTLS